MPPKPNLFIIGAMKSGTTSLHNYLDMHPQIFMSANKEPGYFVEELTLNRGPHWYQSLFEGAEKLKYRGESSTHYTKLPRYSGVAERIHNFNKEAKLIYIMRDPFERMISHYWHAVREVHFGGEIRPIIKAVTECTDYLAFSEYVLQLTPYIRLFGRDAIYVMTFEALLGDPQREISKLVAWLDLPALDLGKEAYEPYNQKPAKLIGVAGNGLLNKIQYSSAWSKVSRWTPSSLKDIAKQIAYRDICESDQIEQIAKLKATVMARQRRQIDALSTLLDRDFLEWPTAASPL